MVKGIHKCELRTKAKNDFEDLKLINNSVFGKTMKNVGKYTGTKYNNWHQLVSRRYLLGSQTNYHKTKWFSENVLAIEMKKTEVKTSKAIYLDLSVYQ